MRTTVDLPPAVHRRALELARAQHRSMSSVVVDLVLRGIAQLDSPLVLTTDARSGLPVLSVGRTITTEDVVAALDDE